MEAGPAKLHVVRPREHRRLVDFPVLIKFGSASMSGRVRNVSMGGFFIECATPLLVGTPVSVFVPQIGELPAQIRWALRGRMGAVFEQPLPQAVKDRLSALLSAVQGPESANSGPDRLPRRGIA